MIDDRKFDFRIYMLVASTNPLIVYYHDGFLRISLTKYDKNSTKVSFFSFNMNFNCKKSSHLTNTEISKGIFANPELYANETGVHTKEEL